MADDTALTAGAVARRLGVAVTTLRTWHQRYGLGPSQHVPGQHRRYTLADLETLDVMRRLTVAGVAPAEAAAWARSRPSATSAAAASASPAVSAATHPATTPAARRAAGPAARPTAGRATTRDGDTAAGAGARRPLAPPAGDYVTVPESLTIRYEPASARDGGGHAIATGRAGPAARGLARAAMRLDAMAMRDVLERAVADRGVVEAWNQVIVPVLVGIGERYAATHRLIEVEHLASRCVTEVLGTVPRPPPGRPPRTLLSCADEEQHSLALEALSAALAEAGEASRLLGARMPASALAEAVARTGPAAVVVWSQAPRTADPGPLLDLVGGPRRPLVVAAAGPGWSHRDLPTEITALDSLEGALQVVLAATDAARVRT